jgi:hypothetical protein
MRLAGAAQARVGHALELRRELGAMLVKAAGAAALPTGSTLPHCCSGARLAPFQVQAIYPIAER